MYDEFVLTEGEKQSRLWRKLCEYLNERLASNRLLLESNVDQREADKLRGRIAEDKLLIALNEDEPSTEPNVFM